jgi:hypothetical protein
MWTRTAADERVSLALDAIDDIVHGTVTVTGMTKE